MEEAVSKILYPLAIENERYGENSGSTPSRKSTTKGTPLNVLYTSRNGQVELSHTQVSEFWFFICPVQDGAIATGSAKAKSGIGSVKRAILLRLTQRQCRTRESHPG